jgi:ABC-type nickel/cobalt efflux system permease component RcnA
MGSVSIFSLLTFGFVLGLKHAIEADHLAAITTIASERRSLLSSSLVGALWGLGHTISLMIAGIVVILLHFQISDRTSQALEFCVGVMLVGLGVNALRKLTSGGHIHLHVHEHGGHRHAHPHIHERAHQDPPHTHHGLRFGARPLLIGMVHGMAGSAALMLLVLTTIPSPLVGLSYIVVFGVGSIGGMMVMSTLVALPARFTVNRFTRVNFALRGLAGLFSLSFGLFMVYQIGFVDHLLR